MLGELRDKEVKIGESEIEEECWRWSIRDAEGRRQRSSCDVRDGGAYATFEIEDLARHRRGI